MLLKILHYNDVFLKYNENPYDVEESQFLRFLFYFPEKISPKINIKLCQKREYLFSNQEIKMKLTHIKNINGRYSDTPKNIPFLCY